MIIRRNDLIEPGMYTLLPGDSARMGFSPRLIDMTQFAGCLDQPRPEYAARFFIEATVKHGAWVGITTVRLADLADERDPVNGVSNLCHGIKALMDGGLLVVANQRSGFLKFLNGISMKIICPTPALAERVQKHQRWARGVAPRAE